MYSAQIDRMAELCVNDVMFCLAMEYTTFRQVKRAYIPVSRIVRV